MRSLDGSLTLKTTARAANVTLPDDVFFMLTDQVGLEDQGRASPMQQADSVSGTL